MSKLRVLIADDQESEILVARDALQAAQHHVDTATSFSEARRLAATNRYDIAVIDRGWYKDRTLTGDEPKGYKGWDIADAVRARSPEALMILYTVHANDPLTIKTAAEKGMICVKKSFSPEARENLAQTAIALAVEVYQRTRSTTTRPASTVFVSYAREDQSFALALAARLKERGEDVWIDQRDISGGDNWVATIDEELLARDSFMIILSPDAVASSQVQRELQSALKSTKRIIPILYKPCQVPKELQKIHWLKMSDQDLEDPGAMDAMLQAIQ